MDTANHSSHIIILLRWSCRNSVAIGNSHDRWRSYTSRGACCLKVENFVEITIVKLKIKHARYIQS